MTEPEKDKVTSSTPADEVAAATAAATAAADGDQAAEVAADAAAVAGNEAGELDSELEKAAAEAVAEVIEESQELAEAKASAADWQDKYVRLHAEWDTYRRRMTEQRAAEKLLATEKLMESLIPVLDDFVRTVDYAETNGEAGLLGGVKAVQSKLVDVLGKGGLAVINPEGEAFDALACHGNHHHGRPGPRKAGRRVRLIGGGHITVALILGTLNSKQTTKHYGGGTNGVDA